MSIKSASTDPTPQKGQKPALTLDIRKCTLSYLYGSSILQKGCYFF